MNETKYTFQRQKQVVTEQGGRVVEVATLEEAHAKALRMSAVFKTVICAYRGKNLVALYDRGVKRYG